MNIIVVGCGKIGIAIARELREEEHDIVVVDKNPAKIDEATSSYDIMGVVGNGVDYSILEEAGIDDCDLLIAVTGQDELNLLCCIFAKKNSRCHTLARVRNPLYSRQMDLFKKKLGISMIINPELESALEISRILRFPSAIKVDTFAKGKLELLNFKVSEGQKICNLTVREIHDFLKCNVMFCAVEHGDDLEICNGQTVFHKNDIVYMVASPRESGKFFRMIGLNTHQVKNCLIVGGSRIAYYLTDLLVNSGINVRIMDMDQEKCEFLAENLPQAVIVNADASDYEQLMEEGLDNAESFVALTNIDEENMFLALVAKKNSKAKVISKVNRISIESMSDELDVGSIITPTNTAANYILQHVRAMNDTLDNSNIERLYKFIDGRAEAIEFLVKKESRITGIPLKDLPLKKNILIAFIARKDKSFIPFGDSTIESGDSVIVITTHKGFRSIEDIVKKSAD